MGQVFNMVMTLTVGGVLMAPLLYASQPCAACNTRKSTNCFVT